MFKNVFYFDPFLIFFLNTEDFKSILNSPILPFMQRTKSQDESSKKNLLAQTKGRIF